ncbi:MAG: aspartate ammonia-lyase [Eubacterium sp.]
MRKEKDIAGELQLNDTVYGIHTKRAVDNFDINYHDTDMSLIYAMVKIKKAAAITYSKIMNEESYKYKAISDACDDILSGRYDEWFVTNALQGGAGTSAHMNVNEVVANLALKNMGKTYGEYSIIHPIDTVNRGQSTNDVYPTALRIAAIDKIRLLSNECAKLQEMLQKKEKAYESVKKLGRTELMDAVEVTLGDEFGAYAQAISRDRWRLYKIEERLRQVNIGGTAVGLSDNAINRYKYGIIEELRNITGFGLAAAEYPMDITQNNDVFVEVSGLLKALAVNLMKISNDLRLMNSGPNGGLGEIKLKPLQNGSSIMPGKVNPVIPEMIMQVSMKVIANDTAITMAASHGEFELNAFMPLIADSLLESLNLLTGAIEKFRVKCIDVLDANEKKCQENLENSYAFATQYTTQYGYDKVSKIVHENENNINFIKSKLLKN